MVLNLHPKCANPSCAAAFDWMAGGKLFRFHRISGRIASVTDRQTNGAISVRVGISGFASTVRTTIPCAMTRDWES